MKRDRDVRTEPPTRWAPPMTLTRVPSMGTPFPVVPHAAYRVRFRTRGAGRFYWGIVFFDHAGERTDDDHVSSAVATTTWRTCESCFSAHHDAVTARLYFQNQQASAIRVDAPQVTRISNAEALGWITRVAAALPPPSWLPPPNRWSHLPVTRAALRAGTCMRLVMLGDSIVNDTANSGFAMDLSRHWRGTRVCLIHAVRGGAGCDWFRVGNRLNDRVRRHAPTLVAIGGISNANVGDVAAVVESLRRGPACDVLLMSGAVGRINPLADPDWAPGLGTPSAAYRRALRALARDTDAGFLDLETAWGLYVREAGLPWKALTRDAIHANDNGRAILHQFMVRYLG